MNNQNNQSSDQVPLLERQVDRKTFLKYVGLGALGVAGLHGALQMALNTKQTQTAQKSPASYGAGPYGGGRRAA